MGTQATDIQTLNELLLKFTNEHIYPNEATYHAQLNSLADLFSTVPLMEELKEKAKAAGLWNLWLPKEFGGLRNEDYAGLAEIMGRVLWAPVTQQTYRREENGK